MTVIVWDGKRLAADKRATRGALMRTVTKIIRHNGELIGVSGQLEIMLELRAWYMAGALAEKFPQSCRAGDKGTLVVIDKHGKQHSFCDSPYPVSDENPYDAWGNGRDFALAAMYCGKTAPEAVEVTAQFCQDVGNGVDVLWHPLAEDHARLAQPLPMTESSQAWVAPQ